MPSIKAKCRELLIHLLPAAALVAAIAAVNFAIGHYWPLIVAPLSIAFLEAGRYWQENRWLLQLKPPPADRPPLPALQELARKCGFDDAAIFIEDDSALPVESFACCRELHNKPFICLARSALLLFDEAELKMLCAHELAHFRYRHHRRDRLVRAGMFLLAIGFLWGVLSFMDHRAITIGGLLAEIITIVVVLWLFQILTGLILYMLSRGQEKQANQWALEATEDPGAFISCFKKIADLSFTFHLYQSWNRRAGRQRELEKIIKLAEQYAQQHGIALDGLDEKAHPKMQ